MPIEGNTIALCMMVKNEAMTLNKAIASVFDYVDEIIIGVDKNSTDDSYKIAKKWVRLKGRGNSYRFKWINDFSKSRNLGLEKSTCDYNLILDGHEYLEVSDSKFMRTVFSRNTFDDNKPDSFSFNIYMKDAPNKETALQPRLVRSHYRYHRALHNTIQFPEEAIKVGCPDIVIVHDRPKELAEERAKQRHEMYVPTFTKALEKDPNDVHALYYMGVWYANDDGWDEAIPYFERYCDNIEPCLEAAKVMGILGMGYRIQGNYEQAKKWLHEALRIRWDVAQAYIELGDIADLEMKNLLKEVEAGEKHIEEVLVERNHLMQKAEFYYKAATNLQAPLDSIFLSKDDYTWKPWLKLASLYDYAFNVCDQFMVITSFIRAAKTIIDYGESVPEDILNDVASRYNYYLDLYKKAIKQLTGEIEVNDLEKNRDTSQPMLSGNVKM